jgi:hypothetical protein
MFRLVGLQSRSGHTVVEKTSPGPCQELNPSRSCRSQSVPIELSRLIVLPVKYIGAHAMSNLLFVLFSELGKYRQFLV